MNTLSRYTIRFIWLVKKLREKTLLDYDDFCDVLLYIVIPIVLTLSVFAGSFIFLILTK